MTSIEEQIAFAEEQITSLERARVDPYAITLSEEGKLSLLRKACMTKDILETLRAVKYQKDHWAEGFFTDEELEKFRSTDKTLRP